MRRVQPGSVVEFRDEIGNLTENYGSVCAHCQRLTMMTSQREVSEKTDLCRQCMRLVCLHCAGKGCTPWEKQMEAQEHRGRFRQALECA